MKGIALMLLLCLSFLAVFSVNIVHATTNTTFTTPSDVYSAFNSLVNNSTIWKQRQGLSDLGNTIYGYWIRTNQTVACDINHDGKIGLGDLVCLALAYNTSPGDSKWNPSADINCNGQVALSDVSVLAQHYNKHGSSLPSKVVLLDGCIHGREYESATILYNFALFLSNSSSQRATNMTNSVQFFIIPIINYDKFGIPIWNGGGPGNRTDANCVDINSNFLYDWNQGDATYGQSDYRGPSACSENETQILRNIFNHQNNPFNSVYIDLHCGGGWLRNWNGTVFDTIWDSENQTDLDRSTQLWNNYTAVNQAYNMTYEKGIYYHEDWQTYNNTDTNTPGASTNDLGYTKHVPSVTIELFNDYNNWTYHHPTDDQLNGTMLEELKCFVEGTKNFLIIQGAYAQPNGLMLPLDESSTNVHVTPATTNTSQYDTITVNITISDVTDLAGWQFALTWNNQKLNCTGATTYDPSCWSGSLSCDESLNNSYTSSTGQYFIAKAMKDGDTFNGTITIASLTFYVLGFNTNTTLSLSNVELCDSSGNNIATSTTNGTVHIDNQQ